MGEPVQDEDLWSTVVPHTSRADRGDIRRACDPSVHPQLGVSGCRTLYEGFRLGQAVNPMGPCMGFRAVSTSGFATPFIYSSYTECLARINAFGAGLERLNLVQKNEDGIMVIAMYMKNCMEFVIAEQGIYCIGGCTAALYDTFGPAAAQFILGETGAKSVVTTRAQLPRLCEAKKSGECPIFQYAIVVDGVTPASAQMASEASLEVISFAKVEAVGAQRIATEGTHKHNPPSPNDIATFCYTSGTTGNPKGAMLTHQSLISAMAGIPSGMIPEITDRHLSYMPLAHIFERIVMNNMFLYGASVGFWRGDPLLLIEDLQACRPTQMAAAPRVLNKVYDKVVAGMAAAGGMKKKIFDAGIATKSANIKMHGQLTHPLYDRLIFNKIKKALGMDQIRILISGSAPLAENVMMFFRCLLGCPVLEGYGQTEGCAAATIVHVEDMTTVGHVGGPVASIEIVLMDVPEMGYLHTDKMHRGEPCRGRGEVCIRGPSVFKGYYKDETKTKETIDEEGWLHSGDIGLWTPQGALKIVDRKKNLFKLSQGEYIAPEKIENILIMSPLIGQCFVYGDSLQNSLVAIVVPDEEPVRTWANNQQNDNRLAQLPFEELCKSETLKAAMVAEIKSLSKKGNLNSLEVVKAIHLEAELFSVENGLLTPTFKMKRKQMKDKYEREIEQMYASLPPPKSKL
ncbi:chain acyl-CoA synthetase 7, peroxisomal [Seminavis robusta]|uniref:Long-chain-fatty-acid--CoA ligase n=1 Tax=Seminavis robusta TaxID=568900 RepID=A0A9N8E9I2_9STRA|nr:chain acyl-CoA synthetase 7, peroxisomal [Seminavis robusta]|eukprot:Sro696_g188870.1 chain acyl-CoA synthetase 7, peroxisomal (684) ;mRNA; r:17400-19632